MYVYQQPLCWGTFCGIICPHKVSELSSQKWYVPKTSVNFRDKRDGLKHRFLKKFRYSVCLKIKSAVE